MTGAVARRPLASRRDSGWKRGQDRSARVRQRRRGVRAAGRRATGEAIEARTGLRLEIARGRRAQRQPRARRRRCADGVLTRDAHAVVDDPAIDLVVEVIGGIEPARELITTALANGKPVVTANKELLANVGTELYAAADDAGVDLLFEAAVAGGIPLIRALRESLRGEPIRRVMGIVNGTTNFILTKMTEDGADYGVALAEAQALGFAERDPTADVEGFDAGAKAAIIATIAFGVKVVAGDVYHEGISRVTAARHRGRPPARLRGQAARPSPSRTEQTGEVGVRVHPAMVPLTHPLASVRESYNAVFIEGGAVGSLMFYGRGAGGMPTASAVLGDVIDAAVNLSQGHARIARHVRPGASSGRSTRRRPSTSSASRSPIARACCTRSPACSPATTSASAPPSRRASAPTRGWCSSPTRPRSRRCRPRCASCATSTSCAASAACCG